MIGSVWLSPTGGSAAIKKATNGTITFTSGLKTTHTLLLANWEPVVFAVDSTWKHKKSGTLYEIVMVANRDSDRADFELTINYTSGGSAYASSAASFYKRMERYD